MEAKSACLISCSDHYNHRLNVAAACLKARGYEVTYITSDFDHVTKQPYTCPVPGCVQISTGTYRRNLSLARILSHRRFARDVFRYVEGMQRQPEVLVVLLPPNYLTKYAAIYKRKHPNVRLIFDIFDLWPETFPSERAKVLLRPFFGIWSEIRDRHLQAADAVVTECDLFRQRLGLGGETDNTVYLAGDAPACGILPEELSESRWDLCYLGSVNNIIDIPKIKDILCRMAQTRPVVLHIIGIGERLDELMQQAAEAGAEVLYHGAVFDAFEKQKIMSRCHFGLNILKQSTCIGLTMKSVDYIQNGLPMINNVPADTSRLVEEYRCGIVCDDTFAKTLEGLDNQRCADFRRNTCKLFLERFDRSVITAQYDRILEQTM